MSKPDNRADNAEHLQSHIDHTQANLQEAEDYLDEHASEISSVEKERIEAKNENRKNSIEAFVAEKIDEEQH
ncbi:small acid-soluble spore protein Tlp [Paenibacillus sp. SYP-B3998]|uniref:Small acid-soluble spore protein Tlp n=1 Tax=Paenibacillus sp. SYP-B3998 TaxID=2678564 RepID=A0A6G3ZVU7_9BACL|nr:small acid-soluble spore protein Tlp [Paenibacillus sp. SYP-B3998]NEW05719.1 small acid-soluble spore protein Tlp [Paenibacillus sp. SYP-B3998]